MGVVYAAVRDDLGSVAAVKVLRDAWVSPERRERFAAEQRTLAQLNHPHIARLYDAGAFPDGTPWIVMEYVDGVPLTDYCRTHAHSIAERLRLFRGRLRRRAARAPAPRPPSRPEAVEHPRDEGRAGEAARLRHREAARESRHARGGDADGPAADDARLRVAGADAWRRGRHRRRRVLARRDPVRAAGRQAAVRGREPHAGRGRSGDSRPRSGQTVRGRPAGLVAAAGQQRCLGRPRRALPHRDASRSRAPVRDGGRARAATSIGS